MEVLGHLQRQMQPALNRTAGGSQPLPTVQLATTSFVVWRGSHLPLDILTQAGLSLRYHSLSWAVASVHRTYLHKGVALLSFEEKGRKMGEQGRGDHIGVPRLGAKEGLLGHG